MKYKKIIIYTLLTLSISTKPGTEQSETSETDSYFHHKFFETYCREKAKTNQPPKQQVNTNDQQHQNQIDSQTSEGKSKNKKTQKSQNAIIKPQLIPLVAFAGVILLIGFSSWQENKLLNFFQKLFT